MATRTVTKMVEQKRLVKLSWEEIERKHREYPHEPFTVYALMQSDGEMLGYVIKETDNYSKKVWWVVYDGDQRFAVSANVSISDTLKEAKAKLLELFADKD